MYNSQGSLNDNYVSNRILRTADGAPEVVVRPPSPTKATAFAVAFESSRNGAGNNFPVVLSVNAVVEGLNRLLKDLVDLEFMNRRRRTDQDFDDEYNSDYAADGGEVP